MQNYRFWIIISILFTLLLGFSLGIVIERSIHILPKRYSRGGIPHEKLMAHLSRKLDLTRPQIQVIGGILRLQAIKIKKAKDEFRLKLREIKEETFQKINPHLTPQQQEKFTKLLEAHKRRCKRQWERKRF